MDRRKGLCQPKDTNRRSIRKLAVCALWFSRWKWTFIKSFDRSIVGDFCLFLGCILGCRLWPKYGLLLISAYKLLIADTLHHFRCNELITMCVHAFVKDSKIMATQTVYGQQKIAYDRSNWMITEYACSAGLRLLIEIIFISYFFPSCQIEQYAPGLPQKVADFSFSSWTFITAQSSSAYTNGAEFFRTKVFV